MLATAAETVPTGTEDAKDEITVLGCTIAASVYMYKLAVEGKIWDLNCFEQVHFTPVHYYTNKKI